VVIEVGGQEMMFKPEQVRAIYFGTAPTSLGQPSTASEALKALRALESVTRGGIGYRDYAPRVLDAKIKVDHYLQEPGRGDTAVREAIKTAMGLYVAVSSVWSAKITNRLYYDVDSVVYQCGPAKELIRKGQEDREIGGSKLQANLSAQLIVANWGGIPLIWSCASDKVTEAERSLVEQSR
jgi:hypothetical protein